MTFSDIRQLVSIKLGEQTAFFTEDEVGRATNTAQRLLCLTYPPLLRSRATLTVITDNPFIDIRTLQDTSGVTIGNRLRLVRRVVLGSVMADAPVPNAATGSLVELRQTSVPALSRRARDWMRHQGEPTHNYLHGRVWLGVYKRPIAATTITVIYDAAPMPLINDADIPQVVAAYHRVIAEIAFGLLIVKEGNQYGLSIIVGALGLAGQQGAAA